MTKNELIIYAQTTLTAKEGAKEIPTGSAARIMKRITNLVLYGGEEEDPQIEIGSASLTEITDTEPDPAFLAIIAAKGGSKADAVELKRILQKDMTGEDLTRTEQTFLDKYMINPEEEVLPPTSQFKYGEGLQFPNSLINRYLNKRRPQHWTRGSRVTADSLGVE